MKKIFKNKFLLTLILINSNILLTRAAKNKIPKVQNNPEIVIRNFVDEKAENLILQWKQEIDSNKEQPTEEVKKYVNKNKDEVFKILFLLAIINKLNEKKVIYSNSQDASVLKKYEEQIKINEETLLKEFDKSKNNKKLSDFRAENNHFGLINELKKMLITLDIKDSVNLSRFSFNKNINSIFASLFRSHEEIIFDAYGKENSKEDIFSEIRNDMILALRYSGLFSFEVFLFWAIPNLTMKIEKATDSKTKHIINLRNKAFKLITNFFGIKLKITKVSKLKAETESIMKFRRKNKTNLISLGIVAATLAAIYLPFIKLFIF